MRTNKLTQLWFGDERGYNATNADFQKYALLLWFGDERGYNATQHFVQKDLYCCGLVMKENITQRQVPWVLLPRGCGLVMKEDITQLTDAMELARVSCGLVMKEDITQQLISLVQGVLVVVW